MEAFPFLPAWPIPLSELSWAALALLLAVALGEIMLRVLRLPRITGYVLAGVVLGYALAQFWSSDILTLLRPVFQFAFGLILFELGQRIDLGWLRRNPWLLATSLMESLLAFVFVSLLLIALGTPTMVALLTAGVAAATGPGVVLGVCKDGGARGPVSDRLLLLCALGSCYSFLAIGIGYAWQHHVNTGGLSLALLHPLYLLVGSVVVGSAVAVSVLWVLSRIRPGQNSQTLMAIGMIVLAVSLASALELSVVVTLLTAGVLSRTLDRSHRMQPMDFGLVGRLALIVVFVSTGALLKAEHFMAALVPALGLIAARALGKSLGIFMFARQGGLSLRKASLLSVAMLPMSGAALLWVERTSALWPDLGAQMAAIVLTALFIMELLAPPALQFALQRADETVEQA